MGLLSSFALNIAAGIVLGVFKKVNSNVKSELNSAFNKALKDWSKNKTIRDKNENKLKIALGKYVQDPDDFKEQEYSDYDFSTFFECFRIRIPEYPSAYNYLSDIKDEIRYHKQ